MTLLTQLNPDHDAPVTQRQALMAYDDGSMWRVNHQGIVQGRAQVRPEVVAKLTRRGQLVQVACQWPSGNAIWRPSFTL